MKVGTKSVLFGAHAWWLHPWFVALAWWRLYGFPWDPRLWVAFFVHDLGYWGKPNMDGEEGEQHPAFGAWIMAWLFDAQERKRCIPFPMTPEPVDDGGHVLRATRYLMLGPWGKLVLFHSRFLCKRFGEQPSRLCFADKMAICLTPWWIYRWTAGLTGEIREYRQKAAARSEGDHEDPRLSDREWYVGMQAYMGRWVEEHKDGKPDTWTPPSRLARDESGVWHG